MNFKLTVYKQMLSMRKTIYSLIVNHRIYSGGDSCKPCYKFTTFLGDQFDDSSAHDAWGERASFRPRLSVGAALEQPRGNQS